MASATVPGGQHSLSRVHFLPEVAMSASWTRFLSCRDKAPGGPLWVLGVSHLPEPPALPLGENRSPILTPVAVVGEGTEGDLVSQKPLFDRSRMKVLKGEGERGLWNRLTLVRDQSGIET